MQRVEQGNEAGDVLGEGTAFTKALELRSHVCSENLKWFSLTGVHIALTANKTKYDKTHTDTKYTIPTVPISTHNISLLIKQET